MNNTPSTTPSLQDFSLIRTHAEKYQSELLLQTLSLGFSAFVLDLILSLQADEIEDSLTDSFFLQSRSQTSGHDRGIDAIYIDNSVTPSIVHIFNFKYTDDFRKINNHFPATEIDKILGFLANLMAKDDSMRMEVNPILYSKVQEIWNLFNSQNPLFVVHICSNHYKSFEEMEKKRFEKGLANYTYISHEYHEMSGIVERLTHRDRILVNGCVKAIDKNIFEKSGGDIRALIAEIDARDLLRLVVDDEELRNNADLGDYSVLREQRLLEDAFEDNVRIYLKQRTRINQNIKATALGEESHRFFFYNNGITITCSYFEYPRSQRGPIIRLENIQVVNGSQTIHALFEAFQTNPSKFEEMEILCRIYQTVNHDLSINIAEYTNSQNPVKSRDIRSNDYVQKKLEKELLVKDYYYERKKGQYYDKPRTKRIDAEKAGQVLMAFYNDMPSEAKDNKKLIFADKYEEIFNDAVSADSLLLALLLFNDIEKKKVDIVNQLIQNPSKYDDDSYIMHSSYYLLYLIKRLANLNKAPLVYGNYNNIYSYYHEATELLKKAIEMEKTSLQKGKESYNHRVFLKGNRPKIHLEKLLAPANSWVE